jgi:hypothetical protein
MAKKTAKASGSGAPAIKAKSSKPAGDKPDAASLRVRMYRHGLGDCLLITLPKKDGTPFYIMIDCGIVVGSPKPSIMEDVVQSIIADTNGFVDILVVTHEHYDHVSGFAIAHDLFAKERTPGKLAAGQVWFAWTEDPNDALGNRLREERNKRKTKLAALVRNPGMQGLSPGMAGHIDNVLGFFGMEKGNGKVEGKAKVAGTGPAMEFVGGLAPVRYCRPTDKPITLPEVEGVRIYVLGPPPDEKSLKKTDSTTEVYHLANMGAAQSFLMALPDADAAPDKLERHQPFEREARYGLEDMKKPGSGSGSPGDRHLQFFSEYYFGPRPGAKEEEKDQSWRRIDAAYMDAAAEFALQLDSATNNTSLVLALELIESQKVLLFVGDAQVGNWLSWQNVQWQLDATTTVTASDLLRRTVFYKVGHHGSHNATAKAKGLELMQSGDLVAFIPVNHEMAVKKGWGKMPLPKLVEELEKLTQGRLVQADQDYQPKTPRGEAFAAALRSDGGDDKKLFYEWTMPMS